MLRNRNSFPTMAEQRYNNGRTVTVECLVALLKRCEISNPRPADVNKDNCFQIVNYLAIYVSSTISMNFSFPRKLLKINNCESESNRNPLKFAWHTTRLRKHSLGAEKFVF